jgi:hypothetical protein
VIAWCLDVNILLAFTYPFEFWNVRDVQGEQDDQGVELVVVKVGLVH